MYYIIAVLVLYVSHWLKLLSPEAAGETKPNRVLFQCSLWGQSSLSLCHIICAVTLPVPPHIRWVEFYKT